MVEQYVEELQLALTLIFEVEKSMRAKDEVYIATELYKTRLTISNIIHLLNETD